MNIFSIILAVMFSVVADIFSNRRKPNRAERRSGNHNLEIYYSGKILKIVAIVVIIICIILITNNGTTGTLFPVALLVANDNIISDKYSVNQRFCHYQMDKISGKVRIFKVLENTCPLSEVIDFSFTDVLTVKWKKIGFPHSPTSLSWNGKRYTSYCSTNGGLKNGTSVMVEEKFAEKHPEIFSKQHISFISKENEEIWNMSRELADEASEMFFKSLFREREEQFKLDSKSREIWRHAISLEKACQKTLVYPVARMNQSNALWISPSERIGSPISKEEIVLLEDVEKTNRLPSKKGIDGSEFLKFEMKDYRFTVTDGLCFCSLNFAIKHGIASSCCCLQIRANKISGNNFGNSPDIKGLLVVLPDKEIKKLKVSPVWGDSGCSIEKIFFFKSVVKTNGLYKNVEEFLPENFSLQLRACELHTSFSETIEMQDQKGEKILAPENKVWLGRQAYQALLYGATVEEVKRVVQKTILNIKESSSKSGVYKAIERLIPQAKHSEFSGIKNSPACTNSICKQVWNKFTRACGGKLLVDGAETYAAPSMKDVLTVLSGKAGQNVLKRGEIRVDSRTGLNIGDKVVVIRYPYINPEPTIMTVAGYCSVKSVTEFSIEDTIMLKLGMDFDGDHVLLIWDPSVVKAAKHTLELYNACGCGTLGFQDIKASDEAKSASLMMYQDACSAMGDVGTATSPTFLLYSLIPIGSTPDTIVRIPMEKDPVVLTVKEILEILDMVNVNVTLSADSGKRMAESNWGNTQWAKLLKDIKKIWCPLSEHFAHPYKVRFNSNTFEYESDKWGDGENAGSRSILGYGIIPSVMNILRGIITEGVCGTPDVLFESSEDEDGNKSSGYRSILKSVDKNHGFLWSPEEGTYQGIDRKFWHVKTGNKWYDDNVGTNWLQFGIKMIPDDWHASIDGIEYTGKTGFKKLLLGQFDQYDPERSEAENKYSVSLESNRFVGLSVGIIHHRLLTKKLKWDRDNSEPGHVSELVAEDKYSGDKKVARTFIAKQVKLAIKVYLKLRFDVETTEEQLDKILYNELGCWIMSKHANEGTAADIADFFNCYKKYINEALQNARCKQIEESDSSAERVLSEVDGGDNSGN